MCYVFSAICIETIVLVYSNTNIKMFSQVQCTDTHATPHRICLLCGHSNAIALTALKITVQMIIMGGRGTTLRSWTNLMNHTASSILLMCLWSFGFFFCIWEFSGQCIPYAFAAGARALFWACGEWAKFSHGYLERFIMSYGMHLMLYFDYANNREWPMDRRGRNKTQRWIFLGCAT